MFGEGENAFALLIEHMFNNIHAAEYRQLTIETLTALASFFDQNPSLLVEEAIVIDVTIGHAVNLAYVKEFPEREQHYDEYKSHAWESFYQQSSMYSTLGNLSVGVEVQSARFSTRACSLKRESI